MSTRAKGIMTPAEYFMAMDIQGSIQAVVCLLGFITNIINIKTFLAMGASTDGVTLTLLSLAISDFCVCFGGLGVCIGSFLLSQETKRISRGQMVKNFFAVDPAFIAVFFATVFQIFTVTTILITIYLAVTRCLCVIRPLQFRNVITVRKTLVVVAAFSLFALANRLPILSLTGLTMAFDPRINATRPMTSMHLNRETIKDIIWASVDMPLCIGAQIILSVCIGIMLKGLRSAAEFRFSASGAGNTGSDEDKSKDKLGLKDARIIKQLVLVSSIFIICNTPKLLTYFGTVLEPAFYIEGRYQLFYMCMCSIFAVFDTINSSVNMFVYYFYNAKFRRILENMGSTDIKY
ncbi:phorbol ester/diacylglycerol-binding protein unc-13 [Plakobranchus ocellatus]|uniref:Phorbol ester/diacylglycerol-binding protein unc-13 n=1 Tax=Plakobranchus ocellatus TaxID=259542 RepID=A0AAV4AMR5_9GAST|nr:phorbol ester/diacylglycerol-binding protein unc-13 [Plakobranchus ocellatus]